MLEDSKITITLNDFDQLREGYDSFKNLANRLANCCNIDMSDYDEKLKAFQKRIDEYTITNDPLANFPKIESFIIKVKVDKNRLDKIIKEFCTYKKDIEIDDFESVEIEYVSYLENE